MRFPLPTIVGGLAWALGSIAESQAGPDVLQAFLAEHCHACHGPEKQKGKLRLDGPIGELASDRERVEALILVLEDGEMPPPKEPQPSDRERAEALRALEAMMSGDRPASPLKRLTRTEYTHAVNDLFEADFDLTELLPPDHVEHGFDKFGEGHLMSPHQVDAYLKTARYVADRVLPEQRPETRTWIFETPNFHGSGRGDYRTEDGYILSTNYPWRSNLHFSTDREKYDRFHIPEFGRYRFELEVHSLKSKQDEVIGINLGDPRYPTNFRKIGRMPLPHGTDTVAVELTLNQGDQVSFTFDSGRTWNIGQKPKTYKGAQIKFTRVQVEGPLSDAWLATTSKLILPEANMGAEAIIDHLVDYLTHRPLPAEERAGLVAFGKRLKQAGATQTHLARSLLTALLASPHFIYKAESDRLDDIELAQRLSFFLWTSVPDEALLRAAEEGTLRQDPGAQVLRLLESPKAERFIEDFSRQWLKTDRVDDVSPDKRVFPDVTPLHVAAMAEEGTELFRHVLRNGLSLDTFIDSDFVMVNERLADYYGLHDVTGDFFRPVTLPADSERGGLIGQAGFLKQTSTTFASSPILRGVWILETLYGEKTEPPSDLVIEEPDIRGTTTIKEVMQKHQQAEACFRCHSKIDPLGFALEFYDPVGRMRAEYQNVEVISKTKVKIDKVPIEAEMALADGRIVRDMPSLKAVLMEDRETIRKGIIGKLIAYAIGREMTVQDRTYIEDVYDMITPRDHSLVAAIEAIVAHPEFVRR